MSVSLKPWNTFGVDALCQELISVSDASTAAEVLNRTPPRLVLGGGSNVLFAGNVDGIVAQVNIRGRDIVDERISDVLVDVGAGENWHDVVVWALNNKFFGLENLALIPGTIGAAPIQNIGAYGVELKDVLDSVAIVQAGNRYESWLSSTECHFGYRDSVFKKMAPTSFIITKVRLRLSLVPRVNIGYRDVQQWLDLHGVTMPQPDDVFRAVCSIREAKLPNPKETGNAGSFFKNAVVGEDVFAQLQARFPNLPGWPTGDHQVKIPSAWLIEQAGFKGFRSGDAGTWPNQPLVLCNFGTAQGREILTLANQITNAVSELFGIELVKEVNVIGAS